MRKFIAASAAALSLAAAGAASADTIFTTRAAFDAATTAQSIADFEGIAADAGFVGFGAGPYAESGLTFTGNGILFVIDGGYYGDSYDGAYLTSDFTDPDVVTINFASSNAFAFDFGGLLGSPVQFALQFSNGTNVVTQIASSSIAGTSSLDSFFGIVTDTAFTSVIVTMPDAPTYNALDNVTIATAVGGGVPEPATWALMIGGFAAAGGALRRRRALAA